MTHTHLVGSLTTKPWSGRCVRLAKPDEEQSCSKLLLLFQINSDKMKTFSRLAEVVRGHGGPPPKSLDSDESFKPEHTLFCREFCRDFRTLGKQSAFLGQKQCFLGK